MCTTAHSHAVHGRRRNDAAWYLPTAWTAAVTGQACLAGIVRKEYYTWVADRADSLPDVLSSWPPLLSAGATNNARSG